MKTKIKRIGLLGNLIISLLLAKHMTGQIITNGSFETSAAPVHYQQNEPNATSWNQSTFATGWFPPTGGSPDLFSNGNSACGNPYNLNDNPLPDCFYPQVCTSLNFFGQQNPRQHSNDPIWGNVPNYNYVGLGLESEYIQTELLSQLTAGGCYKLIFYLSRGDLSADGVRMQALFSNIKMTQWNNTGPMIYSADPTAYVLSPNKYAFNRQGWSRVEIAFKATGNEKYLTIGVFDPNGTVDPNNPNGPLFPTITPDLTNNYPPDCDAGAYASNGCGPIMSSVGNCNPPNPAPHKQDWQEDYFYVDDVAIIPDGGAFPLNYAFTSTTVNTSNSYSNTNILLTGNIFISGNVVWNNCQVRCNNGTTIFINYGSTLRLLGGTTISAGCDMMWNGIVVNGNSRIIVDQSSIQDAIVAIRINNLAGWQITGLPTNNSLFKGNGTDMIINGSSQYTNNVIKQTTFDNSLALRDPNQGTNGYGTTGIIFNAQGTGGTETVGGLMTGEGCTFIGGNIYGGQYGITSLKRNINVFGCTFDHIQYCGIYFIGMNPSIKRSLNVQKCNFNYIPECIYSENYTNLTVKSSSFFNSGVGIYWYDNFNCDLIVGKVGTAPSDLAQGNSFKGCSYGIQCWNNKSTGTSNQIWANGDPGSGALLYTDIEIGNNVMYGDVGNPLHIGIGLSEYVLGSNVAYHSCQVSNNGMTLTESGIEFLNVAGWGIFFSTNLAPTNYPFKLENNNMGITTQSWPWAKGITMKNSPGTNIIANGIFSDAPANWQNFGIYLENCGNTQVEGNAVNAGTGILLVSNNLNSNVLCNSLVGNSCGIDLVGSQLRPSNPQNVNNSYHGKFISPGNWQAYNNYFTSSIGPWAVDIQNYFSANDENKWVWDNIANSSFPKVWNSATASFETNKTATSIISPYYAAQTPLIGTDDCQYGPVYGGNIFDVPFASGPNLVLTLSDPVEQWVADYNYQVQKNNTGQGNSGQASQTIKRIIKIEDAISQQDFSLAYAQMNGFVPTNTVEQNYKYFLTVMLAVNNPIRVADTTEKITLIAIAQQNPRVGGPSVFLSRAYLFYSDRMRFADEDVAGPKVFGMAYIQSPCCLTPASGTTLTFADQYGNQLPIPGAEVYQDGSFTFDPFQLQYYSSQFPNTLYRITEKAPSKYTSLNKEFKTLTDWITASPVTVLLGGVLLDTTKVTLQPDTVIAQVTSAQDATGNTFNIGVAGSQNIDFLIEKRDPSGQILWSHTFDGPSAGNDTATALTLDNLGNVYVVGKVWNGNHYDFQALKYDSTGFMQWSSILNDTLGRNNEPTGVCLNPTDGTVSITGKCCNQSQTQYRIAKYKQCITSSSNRMMQLEIQQALPVSLIEYYPNPSDGTLNIVLKNISGGKLELFNLNGQLMYAQQITHSGEINLAEDIVPDGVYLLKFTTASFVPQFGKVVIHRN